MQALVNLMCLNQPQDKGDQTQTGPRSTSYVEGIPVELCSRSLMHWWLLLWLRVCQNCAHVCLSALRFQISASAVGGKSSSEAAQVFVLLLNSFTCPPNFPCSACTLQLFSLKTAEVPNCRRSAILSVAQRDGKNRKS